MSSDTYVVTTLHRPEPTRAFWRVRPTTAISPGSFCQTESFVRLVIDQASPGILEEPSAASLFKEDFHRQRGNTDISRVVLLEHANSPPSGEWPADIAAIVDSASQLRLRPREDELAKKLPYFVLAVEVTDPGLLDVVPEVMGTTAYDVLWGETEPPSLLALRRLKSELAELPQG